MKSALLLILCLSMTSCWFLQLIGLEERKPVVSDKVLYDLFDAKQTSIQNAKHLKSTATGQLGTVDINKARNLYSSVQSSFNAIIDVLKTATQDGREGVSIDAERDILRSRAKELDDYADSIGGQTKSPLLVVIPAVVTAAVEIISKLKEADQRERTNKAKELETLKMLSFENV
jgi:hypothetical protein